MLPAGMPVVCCVSVLFHVGKHKKNTLILGFMIVFSIHAASFVIGKSEVSRKKISRKSTDKNVLTVRSQHRNRQCKLTSEE